MNKEELKKLKKDELIEIALKASETTQDADAEKIKDQRDGLMALLHLIFLENTFKKKAAKKYNQFLKEILK
jgi:hypothetical protein